MTTIKATVNAQKDLRLRSSISSRSINSMDDIDVAALADGSVLVYKQETSKWTSTLLLEKQTIDCGQY